MNRKRKLKQMRRFLLQYGEITRDTKREPDWFYRKGSHFVAYDSYDGCGISVGHRNRYLAYQGVVQELKNWMRKDKSEFLGYQDYVQESKMARENKQKT